MIFCLIFFRLMFLVLLGLQIIGPIYDFGFLYYGRSSIAGKRGSSNNSAYVATKFAKNGLIQSYVRS